MSKKVSLAEVYKVIQGMETVDGQNRCCEACGHYDTCAGKKWRNGMSETVNVPIELSLAGCAEIDGEMVLLLAGGWGTLRGPHVEELIRKVIEIEGYIPRYRQDGNIFVKVDDWKGEADER